MSTEAYWISDSVMSKLEPVNVFHRQLDRKNIDIAPEMQNLHILFRREFELEDFSSCLMNISADDYYKLYINGEFVAQGPAPGYPSRYFYNEIDVSKFLKPGKNLIAVHTYYQGLINRVWVSGDQRHGLFLELFADSKLVLASDESFRCRRHSGFTQCGVTYCATQFLEHYDARSPEVNFADTNFDDSHWDYAQIRQFQDYTLIKQPSRQLVFDEIMPKKIEQNGNRIKVDFDAINVGYLEMSATGIPGSTITLHFAQELNEDSSLRWQLRTKTDYEEFFTLSGKLDRLNEYDYKAFRYVEIILPEGAQVAVDSIKFRRRHYPFELKAVCNTSDEKLLQVWQLCCDTLHYGVQEVIQDCMDREKGYYMGDGCYTLWTYCLLTNDFTLLEKFFDDFFTSSFINRGLMTCGCCSFMQEIAEYPLIFIMLGWMYCAHTGRTGFLRRNYERLQDILDYYHEEYAEADGLLNNLDKWCVVEWPKQYQDNYDVDVTEGKVCPIKHNVINAYYIGAVKSLNRIAAKLGKSPYKDENALTESFLKAFYDPATAMFRDSTESDHISSVGNIFAAFFGLCPDNASKQKIVELIRQKRFSGSNFFTTIPMLTFLKLQGEEELLYSLLTDEGAWLNTLREGGKRTFEGFGKASKWNTSLFHLTLSLGALFLMDWNLEEILDFSGPARQN